MSVCHEQNEHRRPHDCADEVIDFSFGRWFHRFVLRSIHIIYHEQCRLSSVVCQRIVSDAVNVKRL